MVTKHTIPFQSETERVKWVNEKTDTTVQQLRETGMSVNKQSRELIFKNNYEQTRLKGTRALAAYEKEIQSAVYNAIEKVLNETNDSFLKQFEMVSKGTKKVAQHKLIPNVEIHATFRKKPIDGLVKAYSATDIYGLIKDKSDKQIREMADELSKLEKDKNK